MTGSNRDGKKTAESIDKSGIIDIDVPSGGAITVEAGYIDHTGRKTIVYMDGRSDGIDFIVTDRSVTGRSDRAQALIDDVSDDSEDSESDFTVTDDREELEIDLFGGDPSDRIGQSDVIGVMTPGVGLTAGEISAMIGGAHASPGGVEAILKAILAGDDNELVTRHERDDRDDLWELINNTDSQAGDDDGIIVASLTGEGGEA